MDALQYATHIATPLSLAGFIAALIYLARGRELSAKAEEIRSLPEKQRAKALEDILRTLGIRLDDVPAADRLKFAADELTRRHSFRLIVFITSACVLLVCVALSLFAYVVAQPRDVVTPDNQTVRTDASKIFRADNYGVAVLRSSRLDADPVLPISDADQFLRMKGIEFDLDHNMVRVRLAVTNPLPKDAIKLQVQDKFFSLEDQEGRKAELVESFYPPMHSKLDANTDATIELYFQGTPQLIASHVKSTLYFKVKNFTPIVHCIWSLQKAISPD